MKVESASPLLFADIVGQEKAIDQLIGAARRPVHAYLLVGAAGLQQQQLVRGFAAALLCPSGGCGECSTCRRTLSGVHPDLVEIVRAGAQLAVDDARKVVRSAYRRPLEASRQVIVVPDLHLARLAAPVLLKTVEEPPQSTILVLLAETLIPELETIVSRCVKVDLSPAGEDEITRWLEKAGVDGQTAARAAKASGGSPEKARLLVEDPGVGERRKLWRSVPSRLDGTGATVSTLAAELVEMSNEAIEPLRNRHASEIEELAERAKAMGERGLPGRREIEDRHKREERRLRADELTAGLAELAAAYRDRASERSRDPSAHAGAKMHDLAKACDVVGEVAGELIRNPNEGLLLEALFIRLSVLSEN